MNKKAWILLVLILLSIPFVFHDVYTFDKITQLRSTPVFPPIVETVKVELKEIAEDNVVDFFVVKKYLFVIFHDMINATFWYNLTVFDTTDWKRTFQDTFLKTSTFERINVLHNEDDVVVQSKKDLIYFFVKDRDISKETISLGISESIIDHYIEDRFIIILSNSRLFVFGNGYVRITNVEPECVGSILRVLVERNMINIATQMSKPSHRLCVSRYVLSNDSLTFLDKVTIDLTNPLTMSEIYLGLDHFMLIDSGTLVIYSIDGNISRYTLVPRDSVIFESFYDDELLVVTINRTRNTVTYWFYRREHLLQRLEFSLEESIFGLSNLSRSYYSFYDKELRLIMIYGFTSEMLVHELIGDEGFIRKLYLVHTTGYERLDSVIFSLHHRVFMVTSEKLGIERYVYLYTLDGSFMYNLGYLKTRPRTSLVDGKLAIVFTTLEYGVEKLLICFIDKPAVVVLRGIKSSITYRDHLNRSVTYLYGGGTADILLLPSGRGYLRIASRTCYNGPEDLFEEKEVYLKSDDLNFINTTMYSAQLSYATSSTINVLFIDKYNSTRTFTLTLSNKGVCYIPPGEFTVEAHSVETGFLAKSSIKVNAGERVEIDFDQLFSEVINSPSTRNKHYLLILSVFIFIIVVSALFIRSVVLYKRRAEI